MDKAQRKKILNQIVEKELETFRHGLPIDEKLFPKLFDFVDLKLTEESCKNDFSIASIFCNQQNIDTQKLFNWFYEQSVGCDCEILNLEDGFDYLNSPVPGYLSKPKIKKQKLLFLNTDFGFHIEKIPLPWSLIESKHENTTYTFQIGKSTDCIVKLEKQFAIEQLNNDLYWKDLWIIETGLDYNLDLIIERPYFENFEIVVIKSKNWSPVLLWCKSNQTNDWHLHLRTELSRYKGDLKEFANILSNIRVEK